MRSCFRALVIAVSLLVLASASPILQNSGLQSPEITEQPCAEPAGAFRVAQTCSSLYGAFTENAGQIRNSAIKFNTASGRIAFTNYSFIVCTGNADASPVEFFFEGANQAVPLGLEQNSWRTSYFLGNDSAEWHPGVANYNRILYRDLWNGIDLEFTLDNGSLKYQYLVHAFADVSQISVRAEGHIAMSLASDGSLNVLTRMGETITDSAPEAFYADCPEKTLAASFSISGGGGYGFLVQNRDLFRAIVIDPLVYSTYLGGEGLDSGMALAVGKDGSAYVTGVTDSGAIQPVPGSQALRQSHDVFVAKLDPTGQTLEYAAFIGGAQYDSGNAIAVDASGCAYITGLTQSADFPVTATAADKTYGGVGDSFIAKLGADGSSLEYSTYLGGSHDEEGSGIALDEAGQAYVTGYTWSADFPASLRAYSTMTNGDSDTFVTKVSAQGDIILYSTFLGGTGSDSGTGIAVLDGYAYVTGTTSSRNFPLTPGQLNVTLAGENVFVTKLSMQGSALVYSAILGGSGTDTVGGIAVDAAGEAYIIGDTNSTNLQTTLGALQPALKGGTDLFLAKLNNSGESAEYCTYLGGTRDDVGAGIAVDPEGQAHATGFTFSANYPTSTDGFNRSINGKADAFITKLAPDGDRLVYSTFMGGTEDDSGNSIALTDDGCVFVAGQTDSDGFPVTGAVPGKVSSGGTETFVAKADIIAPTAIAGPDMTVNESNTVRFDGSASHDNVGIVNYTWSFLDGCACQNLSGPAPEHFFAVPGNYTVTLTVLDSVGNSGTDSLTLTVLVYPIPIADAGADIVVNQGETVLLDGTASHDNIGVTAYSWTFSDGINSDIMSADSSDAWTFEEPGIYQAALTVYDEDGNLNTTSMTVTVLDITAPVALAGQVPTSEAGSEIVLDGSASTDNVGIANWTWTFVHNSTAITLYGPVQSCRFWSTGTTAVTLTVRDAAGNTAVNVIAVTVSEPPEPAGIGPVTSVGIALLVVSALLLLAIAMKGRGRSGKGDGP